MSNQHETGEPIELIGKSGQRYFGRIYSEKQSHSSERGAAISLLTNSQYTGAGWQHQVNSAYHTENVQNELIRFGERDDISHLIILPHSENPDGPSDKVDDLIRQYIHS